MKRPIRFLPEARAELDEAAAWYEQRQVGLGLEFVAKVRDLLDQIATNPRLYPAVDAEVRQAAMRRFPCLVVYREEVGEVVVVAVWHSARDPALWQSRT